MEEERERRDGWVNDGWRDGWTDGWMDGRMDRWMDRGTDGQMDGFESLSSALPCRGWKLWGLPKALRVLHVPVTHTSSSKVQRHPYSLLKPRMRGLCPFTGQHP